MEAISELLGRTRATIVQGLWGDNDHPSQLPNHTSAGPLSEEEDEVELASEQQLTEGTTAAEGPKSCDGQAGLDEQQLSTCEEEQARNAIILNLAEEQEDDYTDGPCRLVEAFDGVKGCIALLIPSELSFEIQKTVTLERQFKVEELKAKAREKAIGRFQSRLDDEKLNHVARIACEEARNTDADEGHARKAASLREELDMLELLSANMRGTLANIELNMKKRARTLATAQEAVIAYLEDACVHSQLMGPNTGTSMDPIPEFDLQEEYQTLCDQLQEVNGGPRVTQPLDTSNDYLRANVPVETPTQKSMRQASSALWQAKERLQEAQHRFDTRNDLRAAEFQQNVEAEESGKPSLDASVDDFDRRWVVCNQEITRQLVEAEEAVSDAKQAAREAGLAFTDAQSSCFGDDLEDGLLLSCENDAPEAIAGDPRIESWFSCLSEQADPTVQHAADVDDWGGAFEVEISDSASAVAQGSQRRRISKWNQACGQWN